MLSAILHGMERKKKRRNERTEQQKTKPSLYFWNGSHFFFEGLLACFGVFVWALLYSCSLLPFRYMYGIYYTFVHLAELNTS